MRSGSTRRLDTRAKGDATPGDPLKCLLARPPGVFVDTDGAVFIGASENNHVLVLRR